MIKLTRCVPVLVAALFVLTACEEKATMTFQPYTAAAFENASAAQKAVVVLATADWCPSCRELHETTLTDPAFIAKFNGFTRLKIDYSKRDAATGAILSDLNVRAIPTMIIYSKSGEEVQRFVGNIPTRDASVAAAVAEAR